ncbi:MAG: hypothetical protein ACRD8A_06100 [Candidatus Acidiferrales bacterium]
MALRETSGNDRLPNPTQFVTPCRSRYDIPASRKPNELSARLTNREDQVCSQDVASKPGGPWASWYDLEFGARQVKAGSNTAHFKSRRSCRN